VTVVLTQRLRQPPVLLTESHAPLPLVHHHWANCHVVYQADLQSGMCLIFCLWCSPDGRLSSEQKAEEDYETILSNLANDIQKRQLHLSEIRLRERRSTLLTTLYTLAAWVAYVSVWYLSALPGLQNGRYIANPTIERAVKAIPVVIGPILCVFSYMRYCA